MQKNITIRQSDFVTSILLQGVQSDILNSSTNLPQVGSHHTWTNEKPVILQRLMIQQGLHKASKQTLSCQSPPITLTSQK